MQSKTKPLELAMIKVKSWETFVMIFNGDDVTIPNQRAHHHGPLATAGHDLS